MSLIFNESLRNFLSCPCCFKLMKTQACLCSNGHFQCQKCWENLDQCPQCHESYRKCKLDRDGIVKRLKCPHPHKIRDCVPQRPWDKHLSEGDGQPLKSACDYFPNEKLYPVGGVLITESEYELRCALVPPPVTNSLLDEWLKFGVSLLEGTHDPTVARCVLCNREKEADSSPATATGPSLPKQDLWITHLECSICMDVMTPPIMLCPTGHSVCEKCFEKVSECPQCKASYGKITPDEFDVEKLYTYKCPKRCRFSNEKSNNHMVNGKEQVYLFTCTKCNESGSLDPFKGRLVDIFEFDALRAKNKPKRNFNLEGIAGSVEFPCEFKGCGEKIKLNELAKHKEDCIQRPAICPQPDCGWIGPVHSFFAHIKDANTVDHGSSVQLDESLKGSINVQLPLQPDGQHKLIFLSSKDAVFVVKLLQDDKERVSVSVQYFGSKKESDLFVFKIRIQSDLHSHKELKYRLYPGNDSCELNELDEIILPSSERLTKGGYVDKEGMMKLCVVIKKTEVKNLN